MRLFQAGKADSWTHPPYGTVQGGRNLRVHRPQRPENGGVSLSGFIGLRGGVKKDEICNGLRPPPDS